MAIRRYALYKRADNKDVDDDVDEAKEKSAPDIVRRTLLLPDADPAISGTVQRSKKSVAAALPPSRRRRWRRASPWPRLENSQPSNRATQKALGALPRVQSGQFLLFC